MRIFVIPLAAALLAAPLGAEEPSLSDQVWGETPPAAPFSGKRDEVTLAAQILLARIHHAPGVIDGYPGGNTARAIRAFEQANDLNADGKVDDEMLEVLRKAAGDAPLLTRYTITGEDVGDGFQTPGSSMAEMAETGRVGYGSASEKLAEKFGMSEGLLKALNPGSDYGAGSSILVSHPSPPPIGEVARIEVDGSANELRAYGSDGSLLATFPATVGSDEFPSPSGTMEVRAIAADANYTFDPSDQEWGGDETLVIPPGPNNPIGGTWIDLGKDGYGIHGTPDPATIGKAASHGCVRLTNWDAMALAHAVSSGTTVEFV